MLTNIKLNVVRYILAWQFARKKGEWQVPEIKRSRRTGMVDSRAEEKVGNPDVREGRDGGVKVMAGFKTQAETIWTRTPCWDIGGNEISAKNYLYTLPFANTIIGGFLFLYFI